LRKIYSGTSIKVFFWKKENPEPNPTPNKLICVAVVVVFAITSYKYYNSYDIVVIVAMRL
jgi:hypothetical protein